MAANGLLSWLVGLNRKDPATSAVWLGVAGVGLLAGLIGWSVYGAWNRPPETDCATASLTSVVAPTQVSGGIQIMGLQPVDLERSRVFCVSVANVVPQAKVQEVTGVVTIATQAVVQKLALSKAASDALAKAPSPKAQADVAVANADVATAQAEAASAQAAATEFGKLRTIVLYLNGRLSPMSAPARPIAETQRLSFTISTPEDAVDANAAFWRDLLSAPVQHGRIPLSIGVAASGQPAPVTSWDRVEKKPAPVSIGFILYNEWTMGLAATALVAVFIGFVGLAKITPLLRIGNGSDSAYSLSLAQMALWLFLTATGYVYIWLVTGQYLNVFTPSLFVLIGISGATAGVAQAIDLNQAGLPGTNGFVRDIVGNWAGGQVQLQRLQIIVWTIILAAIFCWNVILKLTLTNFDANLLILTGIANGVYVSLKPQESKAIPKTVPATPAAALSQ